MPNFHHWKWMARMIAVLIGLLVVVGHAFAQGTYSLAGMKLESITVGSGRDALASGITGTAIFSAEEGKIYGELTIQPEQAWLTLARNIQAGRFFSTFGPSVGYFQDAFMAGPFIFGGVDLGKEVKFTGIYWPAVFHQEPDDWRHDDRTNHESVPIGHFGMVAFQTEDFKLSLAALDFLDEKTNLLPGGSYFVPITDRMTLTASTTWNVNEKVPMFYMGLTWKPPLNIVH